MLEVLSILFAWIFTAAVCVALGYTLLSRTAPADLVQEAGLCFVTGAALLNLLVFTLCALKVAYWFSFLVVGLVSVGVVAFHRPRLLLFRVPQNWPRFWKWITAGAGLLFGLLYLCHALGPEMSPDGSTYHLGLIGRYWRAHGFERITTNMYANLSQGVEMVYLFAYAFGRHPAAAMVHFTFLLATVLMMIHYSQRAGLGRAGIAGTLLFAASPVVGMDGTTAYNDVATAAVLFAVFYLIEVWRDNPSVRLLVPAGLLAGYAYAAKYTAFLAIPYAALAVFWELARRRQSWLRPLLLLSACATLMVLPWMIKNWIVVQNPVSPFFNRWFRNPYTHISFEDHYRWHMRNYPGLKSHWEIPLEVTVRGTVLCGLLGPVFLLAPLALLSLRDERGRRLLFATAVFGATYLANIGTRFLIPPLPFLALAMALALARWRWALEVTTVAHLVLSWPSAMPLYCDPHAWRLHKIAWKEALRIRSTEETLWSQFPDYRVARLVEEKVPAGERVLTFNPIPEAYTTREVLVVYQSALGEVLGDMLWTPLIPDAQPTRQIEFHFSPVRAQAVRVVQTASSSPNHWSVAEFRVYRGGVEIRRSSAWQIRAWPNPWDVQRAFDNSPVTRWRSWEPLFPGMYIEVRFGRPQELDAVVLESANDQPDVRLQLEVDAGDGHFRPLAAQPVNKQVPPPKWLRRWATAELRRAGVGYFVVYPGEFGRDDYQKNRRAWGITMLGEASGVRLYRIDEDGSTTP